MGIGGISIWQLLIILAIVVMVFGTKRLKNLGGDVGEAIKGFRKSMSDGEQEAKPKVDDKGQTINGESRKVEDPLKKD
jgi:sec-independent protein translocase protein TatA